MWEKGKVIYVNIENNKVISEKYEKLGRRVKLIRLSEECLLILENAETIINVDIDKSIINKSKHQYV